MVNGIEHNGVDQADVVIRKVNIGIAIVLIVVRQSNTACEEHHGIFLIIFHMISFMVCPYVPHASDHQEDLC